MDRPLRIWVNRSYATAVHTLRMLRSNPDGVPVHLVASHADPDSPVMTAADDVVAEPDGVEGEYASAAARICAARAVDVLWPTWQSAAVAEAAATFMAHGTAPLVCPGSAARLCTDKGAVYAALSGGAVPIPAHHVVTTAAELTAAYADLRGVGLVCVKPVTGSGADGFRVLRDEPAGSEELFGPLRPHAHVDDVAAALMTGAAPALLVMPVLPGSEFSIDVLALDGTLLAGVVRCKRPGVRSVEVIDAPGLLLVAAEVVSSLGLSLLANVQLRVDIAGRPMLLEVNARASAGLYQTAVTGLNLPWAAVRLLLDGAVPPQTPTLPARLATVQTAIPLAAA